MREIYVNGVLVRYENVLELRPVLQKEMRNRGDGRLKVAAENTLSNRRVVRDQSRAHHTSA